MFSEKPFAFSTDEFEEEWKEKKFLGVLKILLELCFGEFPRVISRKRPPFLGIYRNF